LDKFHLYYFHNFDREGLGEDAVFILVTDTSRIF
jgi:hypothetical protein